MTLVDVTIVGLGTAGLATALELARRGVRVLGLDAHRPPHLLGGHHGETRSVRRAYLEGSAYVPMAQRAWELWRRWERESGEMLLVTTGNLTIGPAEGTAVKGFLTSAKAHGIAHECLTAAEVRRRWPPLAVPDDFVAGLEREAGIVFPERALRLMRDRAGAAGARLRFNEPVVGWRERDGALEIRTATGCYESGRLLVSAGARAAPLLGTQGRLLRPKRVPVCWYAAPDRRRYALGRLPVNFWQIPDERRTGGAGQVQEFYTLPAVTDRGLVKAAFHKPLADCDPTAAAPPVAPEEVAALTRVLGRHLPGLNGSPAASGVCFYTETPDGHFLLGQLPAHANVFAVALGGHGFKFAPVLGEILADLLLDRAPGFDLEIFSFSRFASQLTGAEGRGPAASGRHGRRPPPDTSGDLGSDETE
ncbi:MAG: N-methyl-L-tryptophan oxidase [Desulfosarcinaceae bacterium]|nr:N-methyl-L-tryptophan oxidase [Desulfosarcinaceae bacterium]